MSKVDAFSVWLDGEDPVDKHVLVPRLTSKRQAAEQHAREDWLRGCTEWPRSYFVRDNVTGQLWTVQVSLAMVPTFVAYEAIEVVMSPSLHVLWGGHVLCGDLRLRGVPRDWPKGQRWISLKDVDADVAVGASLKDVDAGEAAGEAVGSPRCEACWARTPELIATIRQLGHDGQPQCACYNCADRRQRVVASGETCDPPDACSTHGRCWTHSEWVDETTCDPPGACHGGGVSMICRTHPEVRR